MKKNKGYTLIELIVVMTIISILVLLATPKFLNYIEMAKTTQIINDSKVTEDLMLIEAMREDRLFSDSVYEEPLDSDELNRLLKEDKIYNKYGKIEEDGSYGEKDDMDSKNILGSTYYADKTNDKNIDFEDVEYYLIDKAHLIKNIRTRLKGDFIINKEKEAVYVDDIFFRDDNDTEEEPEKPDPGEDLEEGERLRVGSVKQKYIYTLYLEKKDGKTRYICVCEGLKDQVRPPNFVDINDIKPVLKYIDYKNMIDLDLDEDIEFKTVEIAANAFSPKKGGGGIQGTFPIDRVKLTNLIHLEKIGKSAFENNIYFTAQGGVLDFPKSLKLIDDFAFSGISRDSGRLPKIVLHDNLITGKMAFGMLMPGNRFKELVIGENVRLNDIFGENIMGNQEFIDMYRKHGAGTYHRKMNSGQTRWTWERIE